MIFQAYLLYMKVVKNVNLKNSHHKGNFFYFFNIISLWDDGGEGNGTPLQYSCLENPMDGGAWWAAVHGVAKSPTQLRTVHTHTELSFNLLMNVKM